MKQEVVDSLLHRKMLRVQGFHLIISGSGKIQLGRDWAESIQIQWLKSQIASHVGGRRGDKNAVIAHACLFLMRALKVFDGLPQGPCRVLHIMR